MTEEVKLNSSQTAALPALIESIGNAPTLKAVEQYFIDNNKTKAPAYYRGIWIYLRDRNKIPFDDQVKEVYVHVGENPTISDIEVILKRLGKANSQKHYTRIWRALKITNPELWDDGKTANLSFRVSQVDSDLFKGFEKMVGLSGPKSLSLLLRGVLLANLRGNVNLVELITSTKRLKPADIEMLKKTLNINLKNL